MIEGRIGSPLIIVDDVVTSGMSALKAIKTVREEGYECRSMMRIVFRGTKEQLQDIEKEAKLQYVFNKAEILELAETDMA